METYGLIRINIYKLYFLAIIGVIISVAIFIGLAVVLVKIFPQFNYINLLLIVIALICGVFAHKLAERKSSSVIIIKFGKKEIIVDEKRIFIENVEKIQIKKSYSHYPKFIINQKNGEKLSYRIERQSEDFDKLIEKLYEMEITTSR
ncbi:hypothetical protein [Flavobacterium sp.]|uniref:hypothetical protein n=1 Tax=Flavobacterium sp. TaxID=239 RepID=UPI00391DF2FC